MEDAPGHGRLAPLSRADALGANAQVSRLVDMACIAKCRLNAANQFLYGEFLMA